MKSGFRVARGGAQQLYGIHADLTTYAKAMGNGYPVAAFGGRPDVMDVVGSHKGGVVHGETDEFSYNITQDPVHVRDFQATILHQFGIDHERFSHNYQGLNVKLTGVEKAEPVKAILA